MNGNRLVTFASSSRISYCIRLCRRKNHNAVAVSEYTNEPEYPPVLDMSAEVKFNRKKKEWHDKITQLPTLEQKFMELNMPKYYGYWSFHLFDRMPTINGLPFTKYATRTHVVNSLPEEYYDEVKTEAEKIAGKIQDQVESLIDFNFNTNIIRTNRGKEVVHKNFLNGLHRIVHGTLSSSVEHIKDSVVDVNPRVEAFWFLGGLQPDGLMKKIREGCKTFPYPVDAHMDRPMQSFSSPAIGVRVNLGLPEVVSMDHPLVASESIPVENLDPRAYGFKAKHKHATITTGYWPGESKEHCHLWMHTLNSVDYFTKKFGDKHESNGIQQKLIISSFSQAMAHASYLGFGPVTELTYPVVQQSVSSDGQRWVFSIYQLSTCALHSDRAINNPRNNVLWLSDQQLFEAVDDTGVKGFNLDVLTTLIAMYLKKGIERENATPYLGPHKYVANHPAPEEYRKEFHNYLLQHLFSGRPRAREKPELYLWEKIYKVDFKTRPRDARKRFFENAYNQKYPGSRRLDEHSPIYIPKALRADKKVKYKPRVNSEHLYKYD